MITDELHAWSIAFKLLLVHLLAPKSNSAEDWNFWKKQLVLRNGLCCKWPRHIKQCPNGWCLSLIMASVCNFRRKLWQSRIAAVCNKLYIKYCKISNNWYTPFSKNKKKKLILVHQFICICKNKIIILLFVQQKHKHNEMVFSTSRNVSKHILFALGVDCTARDTVKVKFTGISI